MVIKNTLKIKLHLLVILSVAILSPLFYTSGVRACTASAGGASPCEEDANFQVNIPEVLTVSIARPDNWATGNINTLLRNVITLNVVSNNADGFTASMTSAYDTTAGAALMSPVTDTNIPMLSSSWTRSDTTTTKFWGFSLNDGSETGTYSAIALEGAVTPNQLLHTTTPGSGSKDIYFAAKADGTIASGTYSSKVIISVVSGVTGNDNPVIPVDPATPSDTSSQNPVYQSGNPGRTIYTATTSANDITTTTTEVSSGDTTASYAAPAGVTTTATINGSSQLATGLAVTAAVSAVAGIAFFIAARRRDDEEDDDEY